MKLSADKPLMENHGGRTSSAWTPPMGPPPADQLHSAAAVLNSGRRVAILAGPGLLGGAGAGGAPGRDPGRAGGESLSRQAW